MSSRTRKWATVQRRTPKTSVAKPWYKRTAAQLIAAVGAIVLSVVTSLATGVIQKLTGIGSAPTPSPSKSSSVVTNGVRSPHRVPLVMASAKVIEDPDQDIWVSAKEVSLSPSRSMQINRDKQNGAQDGELSKYLQDMTDLGAVKSTGIALDLNLSTQSADQVRVDRIRLESVCRSPLTGTVFYSPPAGPAVAIGKIGFDLDSQDPTAREMKDAEGSQTFGGDFFSNNVQYLKKNDGFAYHIVARTEKHYCEFRLKIDASANGISQTISVDNHGQPFRVSALICDGTSKFVPCPKFSEYKRVYAGGVANFQGKGEWIPKPPMTYDGI